MKSVAFRFRRFLMLAHQLATIGGSLAAAFLLRFDFAVPPGDERLLFQGLAVALPAKMIAFRSFRLQRGSWRFAGVADLADIVAANVTGSVMFFVAARVLIGPQFPRSVYCIDLFLCFLCIAGLRFAVRLYYEGMRGAVTRGGGKGLLIYGAGAAGMTLLREIRANPELGCVVGFLDDDPSKKNTSLLGTPVLGTGRDAPRIVDRRRRRRRRVEEIIIALSSATRRQMQEALANCRAAGVPCKTIPALGDLLSGRVLTSQIRAVEITDLLGREQVRLEETQIRSAIAGRSVLVTGAGGSIGSELCRQIAAFEPRTLVLFERAESDLFRLDVELRQKFRSLNVVARIGDICEYRSVQEAIEENGVDSIFHAAAYKHVPLVEDHILEGVHNNVVGTSNVVEAARRHGVSDFLMISSDKAVNPTSIMGATKRAAELIVCSAHERKHGRTKFVSVRFGNVLGSNGSVVPLFQAQIAAGGPVTITHPEVRRYFMTMREAVQLVLQTSTMGRGSEIFVLDMGEPVRIVDLACNMIRLSGRLPHVDIELRFTGLRPGEKLFEELITEGENIRPTHHDKIKIFQGRSLDWEFVMGALADLEILLAERDVPGVVQQLQKMAPEYQPETAQMRRRVEASVPA